MAMASGDHDVVDPVLELLGTEQDVIEFLDARVPGGAPGIEV